MVTNRIIFVSKNQHKINEIKDILSPYKIKVASSTIQIDEIQTNDIEQLVKDKTTKAFIKIKNKIIVEHTGLFINALNNLPGVHTQIFWDTLEADGLTGLARQFDSKVVIAKTIIGYCDRKKIHIFEGEIEGTISDCPKGRRDFQWDCIFIPNGYSQTFAELGPKIKNSISMRQIALKKFAAHFQSET